ncbi:MAG: hypothetical protein JSW58_10035 [Candidatus Latescibacterota bacterium]|nr:MAG: hypothetical protein JSW58_10035 [Candidatus Latescibacterota bacterium]
MKNFFILGMATVIAFVLVGSSPVVSFSQPCPCILVCPQCPPTIIGPGPPGGTKSPDLDGNGMVNLVDLSIFASAWPPGPYLYCADYDCSGFIGLQDLALFAAHYQHMGPIPGYNQPGIDHYKTYETLGPTILGPYTLRDQFGEVVVTSLRLAKVATPVAKNNQEICDPTAHQTWWDFLFPQPNRMIRAQNQFGTHDWMLGDARYLLLPALKNEPAGQPPPELNHYLCYEAQGPTLGIEVLLTDQFDQVTVIVLEGVYFCNPCEKETPDGTVYPIVDPWAHLTVYLVENPVPYDIQALVRDQFMEEMLILNENLYLAVPALKELIPAGSSEWNRIKALYKTGVPDEE